MADIFISYSRDDRPRVEPLAEALVSAGYSVWWDRNLAGGSRYLNETEAELKAAKAVLVVWTKTSVASHWVADEAGAGRDTGRLLPISLDGTAPPLGFRQFQVIDFSHWKPGNEAQLTELRSALGRLIGSSGAMPPSAAPIARKPIPRRTLMIGGLAAAGVALIAAVAMFAMGPQASPPSAAPTSQRVAFFGFTTASDDPAARAMAEAATDEVFETMRATRLETSARTETLDTPKDKRFARAAELGALYALSGEVRSDNGQVSIAIRFEDVSSRTTLSERSISGAAAEADSLPTQAAFQAADTVRCFINERSQLTRETSELLKLVADVCRDPRALNREDSALAYSALASADPDSPEIKSGLARYLAGSAPGLPESAQPARIAEAEAALKQATELDPKLPSLAVARLMLARAKGASMAELETAYLAELGVPGLRAASKHYSRISADLGKLFLMAGRIREAEPFLKLAMTNDPLQRDAPVFLADASALRGQRLAAQAAFEQMFSRRPDYWPWELWISSAVFLGAGDSEAMLKSPPSIIPKRSVDCWRDIRKGAVSSEQKARTAAAMTVADCLAGGAITEAAALASFAALSDVDAAFILASNQTLTILISNRSPIESLFWPTSRAMRADPRFLPLVEKLGLMDYWRATKTQSDACETEDVPFCRELKASAQAGQ